MSTASPVATASDPTTLAAGAAIGRYVVLERLGAGGMGVVYSAYDPSLDRRVVLKLLPASTRDNEEARTRLLREAQALAQLSHPNVVAVHDVGSYADSVFIAMEHVAGATLTEWVKAGHPWPDIVNTFIEAGRGLAAAHRAGLVHRDFKPDNVMVGDDGRVRVLDFGLAAAADRASRRANTEQIAATFETGPDPGESSGFGVTTPLDQNLTRDGTRVGTPRYMAPEQRAGASADMQSDIFSFCVALYEALYDAHPYADARGRRHSRLNPPPPNSDVPGWIGDAVVRGLSLLAERRHGSMNELIDELSADPRARRRRKRLVVGTVAGVAAIAIAALGASAYAEARAIADCNAEAARIAEAWNPERADEVASVFARQPVSFASESWNRARPRVDAFARAWKEQRQAVCREHEVDGALDGRTAAQIRTCLDEHAARLRSLVEQWRAPAPAVILRVVESVQSLPDASGCREASELSRWDPADASDTRLQQAAKLRQELAAASVIQTTGQFEAALARANSVLADATEADMPRIALEARYWVGDALARLGRYEEAREAFERTFYDAEVAGDDRRAMRAATYLIYVAGYNLGRAEDAQRWHRLATTKQKRLGLADDDILVAATLLNNGYALGASGRWQEALDAYTRALAIREPAFGPNSIEVAAAVIGIGNVNYRLGRRSEALEAYQRGLEIRRRALGPDHPHVADAMLGLGAVHVAAGEHEQALGVFQRALALMERAIGPDHVRSAMCRDNVAGQLFAVGLPEAALTAHRQALAVLEAQLGSDHPTLSWTLEGIGSALVAVGRPDEAVETLERAVKLRQKTAPELLADAERRLAEALWASGDRERARATATSALERLAALPAEVADERRADLAAWLTAHE